MRQVQNFIREQKMIMPGDFVIAGVSGGADSVCLFFELLAYQKEIPFSMEVVHIEPVSYTHLTLPTNSLV